MFKMIFKRTIFAAVLLCTIVFAGNGLGAQTTIVSTVFAAPKLDCASAPPTSYPISETWVYPKGFSKSDITQGLIANSPVHGGEFHTGEDYGNKPAGTEVFAVANGWVACQFTNLEQGNFGHAVFVESILGNGAHLTTVYGHLSTKDLVPVNSFVKAGVTRVGRLGTPDENGGWQVHLHLGIRDGFFIEREQAWPNDGWGATPSATEFTYWHSLSTWASDSQASIQKWIIESQSQSFTVPWWRTFFVCDNRRIKVSFDDSLIFYTSSQDGAQPSQSNRIFVWPGSHTLKIELFDYPSAEFPTVNWPLFPQDPACASETITSDPEQPVRVLFDALARDDLDTAINQCFAPQHRPIAKPLLKTFLSARKDQNLVISFSDLNYKTTSNDGQKGIVSVSGIATTRSNNGTRNQYSFDVDVPVFTFLNSWYIDLDIQRLQQLLGQISN